MEADRFYLLPSTNNKSIQTERFAESAGPKWNRQVKVMEMGRDPRTENLVGA